MQGNSTTLHLYLIKKRMIPETKINKIMKIAHVVVSLPYKGHIETYLNEIGQTADSEFTTFEDYKKANEEPNSEMVLLTWEEYQHLDNQYWETDFREITEERYSDALDELPPLKWHWINSTINVFFCLEAMSGSFHDCYIKDKGTGKYFSALKSIYLTDAEILSKYSQSKI